MAFDNVGRRMGDASVRGNSAPVAPEVAAWLGSPA